MKERIAMTRQSIMRYFVVAAVLLWTLSTIAGGKVEVTGDTSHGTVTSKADGAVVTLTVTPQAGYYIRKSDIKATRTFMPTANARSTNRAARNSIPMPDDLALVGNDPDDLSQPRTYTVTLPGEEYDILLDVKYTQKQAITEGMVSLSETVFVYNEQVQRPVVSVQGLMENRDYMVTYSNPTSKEADTYTVTVTGYSMWAGTITRSYKIFRGGKAEVNNSLNGGTIATAVDGLTVTLTVTPADGYYIRKQDVVVAKTFMPVAAPRRTTPVADLLELTGDDPDDLSLPRTYTAQLPGWEYSAFADATFTERQTVTSSMVQLSAASFIYNGSDQKPVITVAGLTEGKDYLLDFAGTSWSDVGTYSLTVTGRSTWKGVVNKTYTITKAPSVVTVAPQPQSLIYSGSAQHLVAAGEAVGGTLMYSLDGTTYQAAIPTGVAAGSYTIYYKVQGDANHTDTEALNLSVTIGKKDIVISGIMAQNKVYDGTTAATLVYDQVVYGGIVEGDVLSIVATGTFVDANAGAGKTVTLSGLTLGGASIGNYQLAESGQQATATATITPRSIKGAVFGDIAAQSYSGEALTPVVTVTLDNQPLVGDKDYTVSYADNVNVGEATVTVTGIGNYQDMVQTTFVITPVAAVVTVVPQPQTMVYSGAAQQLVAAGDAEGGRMLYSLDGTDYQESIPTGVAAGSYTIYYKVQGDSNHTDTEAKTVTATIAKKAITISGIAAQDKVYDGTTAATLVYDAVAFGGMAEGDALTVTAIGTFSDANAGTGKVVTLSALTLDGASIGNYRLAESGQQTTATATITSRSIEGAVFGDIAAQSYSGEALTPVVTVTLDNQPLVGDKDYTVSYADNVNVGEATVTVTGIGNYQDMVQTTFVITPVAAVVTVVPQPQTMVYSGAAQQLVAAGDAEGGRMLYSLDGTDYQESIPTGVAAGSYTIYYKVQGDSNHTDSNPATVVVTMGSKELSQPTILLSSTSYIYDGTAKEPDVTVMDGETVIAASEYRVSYENNINAGTALVIVDDNENGNYMVNGSVSFVIAKAASVITKEPQPLALHYTGEPQVLVVAGDAEGGTMVYSLDGETFTADLPTATEAGVYTVSYRVKSDGNHTGTEISSFKSSITPTLVDKSGNDVEGDFIEGESGEVEVIVNTLPDHFWEDTTVIPSTVFDGDGTPYDVTKIEADAFNEMPADVIVVLPENIETTEPVTNVVNGDGTCETIDLTEVKELSLPIDVEAETVVYDRKVTNGSTSVCLPYDLPVPENTTAYFLDVTDGEGVTLQEVEGVMEAYQPYVLVVNEQSAAHAYHRTDEASAYVVDLGTTNVTFSHTAEAGSVERDNFTLCGTMHTMTHEEGLAMKAYVLQPDNSWRITASSDPEMAHKPYLAPFQAYLLYTGFGEMDEVATTFDSITTCVQPAKPDDKVSSETGWYDLSGRKLGGKPTRKGVYLHQRKVVVH